MKNNNFGCLFMIVIITFFLTLIVQEYEILGMMSLLTIGSGTLAYFELKNNQKNEESQLKEKDNKLSEFHELKNRYRVDKGYYNDELTNGILLDEEEKQIIILLNNLKDIYILNYSEILQIEIVKDGEIVTKVNRKSQIGGAAIGGVLAGQAGALIGGLSGESNTEEKVKQVDLKILVDNTTIPSYSINFFRAPINMKTNKREAINIKASTEYQNGIKDIEYWYNLFTILIIRNGKNTFENTELFENTSHNQKSFADSEINSTYSTNLKQLNRLVELYKEGLLTKDEYENEKKKLLSN